MILTCAASLVDAGVCCAADCAQPATVAILTAATVEDPLVEHTRCDEHTWDALATKPLRWSPDWSPA